jgi:hypothetical protein
MAKVSRRNAIGSVIPDTVPEGRTVKIWPATNPPKQDGRLVVGWRDGWPLPAVYEYQLRQVEQYGVFKYQDIVDRLALPSADGKVTTRDAAAAILAKHSDFDAEQILIDPEIAKRAWRQSSQKTHVDRGGNVDDFGSVQAAKAILFIQ